MGPGESADYSFPKRVLLVAAVAIVSVALLAFLRQVIEVFLIFFAGVMLGVALDGGARLIADHSPLSRRWALFVVGLLLLLVVGGTLLSVGPQIADQVGQLGQQIRAAIEQARQWVDNQGWARALMESMPEPAEAVGPVALSRVTTAFSLALGALGNIAIILFLGIYLAFHPALYIRTFLSLLPHRHRRRGREVFEVLGRALRRWLLGRLVSMATVGVLTAGGLLLIGLPLAIPLGLIAALLSFIPYLGPILSALPAILIGFADSPATAGYVLLVFAVVQTVESYLIDPIVERKAVYIPPGYQITVQLMAALTAGIMGILLATPLAVVFTVLLQMLYLEDVLGDSPDVVGDK